MHVGSIGETIVATSIIVGLQCDQAGKRHWLAWPRDQDSQPVRISDNASCQQPSSGCVKSASQDYTHDPAASPYRF